MKKPTAPRSTKPVTITSNYPQLVRPTTSTKSAKTKSKISFRHVRPNVSPQTTHTPKATRKLAYLALIANAIIWGAALPIVKPSLEFVNPNQFLWLRYLIAAPLLLPPLYFAYKHRQISRKQLPLILLTEFVSIISLILVYFGLEYTTALEASLILNTRPILITIAGILLLHEVEERHEWLGLILSIIGTTIIFAAPIMNKGLLGITTQSILGNLILITSNLVHVVNVLMIKKWYNGISKLAITSVGSWVALLVTTLIVFATGLPNIEALGQASVQLSVLYMAIPGTILAFSFLHYGMGAIESSEASLFSYLQPLIYIPLAILWLNEPFDLSQFLGIGIMLAGVIIAEYRPGKKGIFARTNVPHHH